MAHRDLKLENTLLMDPGPRPRLAICDFGYAKSEIMHSAFHTNNVGTPSYLAPELLTLKQGADYDGRAVDVWAAGVVLYVMLVGGYPFGDVGNGWDLVKRIATASYSLPVQVTPACTDLLGRIFVVEPSKRATVNELMLHPWVTADPPGPAWEAPPDDAAMQTREQLMELLRAAAAKEEDLDAGFSEAEHSAALMGDL
jgi:serine/threonine-protein kinase SRK2